LSGQDDIHKAYDMLEKKLKNFNCGPLLIVPFYSALEKEERDLIHVSETGKNKFGVGRKIILATNVTYNKNFEI
jgi:HrpA-like RNA helicase